MSPRKTNKTKKNSPKGEFFLLYPYADLSCVEGLSFAVIIADNEAEVLGDILCHNGVGTLKGLHIHLMPQHLAAAAVFVEVHTGIFLPRGVHFVKLFDDCHNELAPLNDFTRLGVK